MVFRNKSVNDLEDRLRAVLVDQVREWLQVAASGVVLGVVTQGRPGRDQYEFGMVSAPTVN
ncbi:hypothetical protein [Streptomyces bobili]|uniref:hypothetical protein n=1 Tax=Streptomyces bobili TaxID=67280 RepID=UPI0037BA615C